MIRAMALPHPHPQTAAGSWRIRLCSHLPAFPSPAHKAQHHQHLIPVLPRKGMLMYPIFIILSEKIFRFTSFYYTISITRTCLKAHCSRKMHYILAFKSASSHLLVLIIDWESCSFYFGPLNIFSSQ